MASRSIKRQLGGPLAGKLTGLAWCVTFVTVGELWQWATMRSWGRRAREDLEQWLSRVVVLDSDEATSRAFVRLVTRHVSVDRLLDAAIPLALPVFAGSRRGGLAIGPM